MINEKSISVGQRHVADEPQPAPLAEETPPPAQGADSAVDRSTQFLYEHTHRRGFLARVGRLLLMATGVQVVHLLPTDRTTDVAEASNHNCSAWFYCNCNCPRLCSCCVNGNLCMCPYGTLPASQWWACCWNGSAWKKVQYTDCCYTGSGSNIQCSNPNCSCRPSNPSYQCPPGHDCNRDVNWCSGAGTYYCTTVCVHPSC